MWRRALDQATPSCRLLLNQWRKQNKLRKLTTCAALYQQEAPLTQTPNFGGTVEEERIFPSPHSDVVLPEGVHFSQFLFDNMEKFAGSIAVVSSETGQYMTFDQIRERSLRLGSAYARLGYSKGDVLGIMSPNCPEYILAFLGMTSIGIIPTTFNFSFTVDEVKYQIANAECTGMVCHEEKLPVVREACLGNPAIRHIISIGPGQEGVLSIYDLLKDDGKGLPKRLEINPAEDVFALPYSSGTTGLPKGVMLTHRSVLCNISQAMHPNINFLRITDEQPITLGVLPMYHIFGLVVNMSLGLTLGARTITMKEFNKYKYIDAISKHQVTFLPMVPPLVTFLEGSDLADPSLLKNVKAILCGAAPLGQSLIEKFTAKFGTGYQFYEGYGLTETSPLTHATPHNGFVVGSCGQVVPNTLTKFVDPETGATVGRNEEGEICIKGPQLMKGYLKNEAATQGCIRDGWFHTGDLARIDDNDYVYIVDRLKELIKVKGLQVAPAELENLLREHPGVDDVAVIGVPDERAGELPRAYVVPAKTPGEVTQQELKNFVRKRVSSYKQLESVVFIDEIPKSPSGKILRRELRKK